MSLCRLAPFEFSVQDIEILLRDACNRLQAIDGVERVFLFGSFATGTQHNESDIDFAVIVSDLVPHRQTSINAQRAMNGFPWPTDIVVVPSKEYQRKSQIGGVCFDIAADGIELFPKFMFDKPSEEKE
jgi:Nucleotidyltransferase domain